MAPTILVLIIVNIKNNIEFNSVQIQKTKSSKFEKTRK